MSATLEKWTPLEASLDEAHCPPESLMQTLLRYFWQYECEVTACTHPRTERAGWRVKHLGRDGRYYHLRRDEDSYFWDLAGEIFRSPELAIMAITRADPPPGVVAEQTYGRNPVTYHWWVNDQEKRRGTALVKHKPENGLVRLTSDLVDQILAKLLIVCVPESAQVPDVAKEIGTAFAEQKGRLHTMVLETFEQVAKRGLLPDDRSNVLPEGLCHLTR